MQYGIKLLYLGVQMNRHGINGSGCIADFSGARIFSLLPSFPESISLIYSTHVYKNFRIEHFIRNFVQLWWYCVQWIFFFFHQYEEENHRDRLLTTFVRIIHFPTDVGMNEIGYCFRILPFSCSNGSNCSSSYTRECMHACVNTESSCILRRPCARRANRRGNGWDARERGTSVFSV